jgi:hypothetical protein
MNKRDVVGLIAMNKLNFPNAYKDFCKEEHQALVACWLDQLGPYDAGLIEAAFSRALKVCKFPVTLADIFNELRKMRQAVEKPIEQLWQEFMKASRRCKELSEGFGYTFVEANGKMQGQNYFIAAKDIYNKLPLEVQEYCGSLNRLIDFASVDNAHLEQVIWPAFRRSVEGIRERGEVRSSLPNEVLQQLVNKMSLPEGRV